MPGAAEKRNCCQNLNSRRAAGFEGLLSQSRLNGLILAPFATETVSERSMSIKGQGQ
jgi:hypothetical protein